MNTAIVQILLEISKQRRVENKLLQVNLQVRKPGIT